MNNAANKTATRHYRVIRGTETNQVDLQGYKADPLKFYFEPTDYEGDALWSEGFATEVEALTAAADSRGTPIDQLKSLTWSGNFDQDSEQLARVHTFIMDESNSEADRIAAIWIIDAAMGEESPAYDATTLSEYVSEYL